MSAEYHNAQHDMSKTQLQNPYGGYNSSFQKLVPSQLTLYGWFYNGEGPSVDHDSEFQFPPAFYDNLSKIHLERLALKELNRRNAQAALDSQSAHQPPRRPLTRGDLTALLMRLEPITPATEYLESCTPKELESIKQTAKHGGPDLTDLRGARVSCFHTCFCARFCIP